MGQSLWEMNWPRLYANISGANEMVWLNIGAVTYMLIGLTYTSSQKRWLGPAYDDRRWDSTHGYGCRNLKNVAGTPFVPLSAILPYPPDSKAPKMQQHYLKHTVFNLWTVSLKPSERLNASIYTNNHTIQSQYMIVSQIIWWQYAHSVVSADVRRIIHSRRWYQVSGPILDHW